MKKINIALRSLVLLILITGEVRGQTLPVGIPVLEEYYRTQQLLGKLDSAVSFTLRPLNAEASFGIKNAFDPDSSLNENNWLRINAPEFQGEKTSFMILPFSWQQQYNDLRPQGWNDGAMIPARGYQTMFSGGVFAKLGRFSIQLQPEYVFAENRAYEELDIYDGTPDLPVRFGDGTYSRASWGQSSIRMELGAISFGLSNENLWWGPGRQNSLLMSNNAQGFKHLTLNTNRPLRTRIGSLEFQVIAGKLEGSDNNNIEKDPKYADWRYLSAFALTYQPKWIPGLFVGWTRGFQAYRKDIKKLGDYIPFLTPFQKENRKVLEEPFGRDQLTSIFARWMFVKARGEVYFEYGANDNAFNLRDFIGSPDHSRAYIFGLSKLTPLTRRENEFIRMNAEITQMSQSLDRIIRPAGSWYEHGEVLHGYTHKGEVIGAGIGPGGNLQSLDLSWVKGIKSLGIKFDRYVHDDDYYNSTVMDLNGMSRKWVDMSITGHGTWEYKNLLVNASLKLINTLNYQWRLGNLNPSGYFKGQLGIMYRF